MVTPYSSQFLSGLMLAAPFAPQETCVVFDEGFAFWRSYSGDIAYTTHPSIVRLRRTLLEILRSHAGHRETEAVLELLEGLAARMS